MNHDDRLHRHLTAQASAIPLVPADADAVKRRGTQRRNRRRSAIGAVAAVAVAAGSFSIIDRDGDRTVDQVGLAAEVVASPFDWTVVEPGDGLGYGRSTVLVDGAVYSLSTAPGPYDEDTSFEPHLYRSTDGAVWERLDGPAGLKPSSLGAAGGTLYAIGTSPAGGGARELVVATSTDAAASWSTVALPADVAQLEARHPGQVRISQPSVAALDGDRMVATVVVSAQPDVEELLPEPLPGEADVRVTADGVTVYEPVPCGDDGCAASGERTVRSRAAEEVAARDGDPGGEELVEQQTYTWDELGLDPELRSLMGGRTYVYASDDGETFERVDVPGGDRGWGSTVLAHADGFHLLVSGAEGQQGTQVLTSPDGRSWTDGGALGGSVERAGLLAGRPAVSVIDDEGTEVRVAQPDGSWAPLDLMGAVDRGSWIGEVAFGPLGVAAVVGGGGDGQEHHLVHSPDGATVSVVPVGDHVERGTPVGLTVTADGIFLRIDQATDADPTTPPIQRVLTGTPR